MASDNEAVNMDRVHQMVTQLMAVPPNDATQGEVIIAFGKAVALMAYIDCIQHSYDNQTVIVSEYHEH
jgi:hypothetical protein